MLRRGEGSWELGVRGGGAVGTAYLPRLKARSGIFKAGGAGGMVHKVSHALRRVLHLPAGGQGGLLDHPDERGGEGT